MQKVDFRYSDTDFVTYLLTLGYQYTSIEVVEDKTGMLKGYFHFEEDKEELLSHYQDYINGRVVVDLYGIKEKRHNVNKIVKAEITKHRFENKLK